MNRWWRILLFFPFLLLLMYGAYSVQRWRLEQRRSSLHNMIGQPFPALPLLDTAGKWVPPSFSQSAFTLVYCWFRNCPYCLAGMRQMRGFALNDSIRFLCLSIDEDSTWRKALRGNDQRWAFLKNQPAYWIHARVAPKGGDKTAAQLLADSLSLTGYPGYFLINPEGIIIATPRAAELHKILTRRNSAWWSWLMDADVWTPWRYMVVLLVALWLYWRWVGWLKLWRVNNEEAD